MMGTGEASGEKRALTAAEAAIANPLIDDASMKGARGLLISITGGKYLPLYEVDEAATRIREEVDQDANIIVGQSHFIKTVEDIYEAVVGTVPQGKFGLAFNESSGTCLVRTEGNDDELRAAAVRNAQAIGAGHVFVLLLRNAYPINLLPALRNLPEVCSIFCATANSFSQRRASRAASISGTFWSGTFFSLHSPVTIFRCIR